MDFFYYYVILVGGKSCFTLQSFFFLLQHSTYFQSPSWTSLSVFANEFFFCDPLNQIFFSGDLWDILFYLFCALLRPCSGLPQASVTSPLCLIFCGFLASFWDKVDAQRPWFDCFLGEKSQKIHLGTKGVPDRLDGGLRRVWASHNGNGKEWVEWDISFQQERLDGISPGRVP